MLKLTLGFEDGLGLVYTECSINAMMTIAILLSLKIMESLQNGIATHFGVTPLYSMEKSVAKVIAALTLTPNVNGPLNPTPLHGNNQFL